MSTRASFGGMLLCCAPALLICLLASSKTEPQQTASQSAVGSEPAPPEGQTFIGTKKCAACHFEQFGLWRKDKHAEAFEILPAKYKTDASCLECHTTGYGEATGYKTSADEHLAGTSCEACHGPGSEHERIVQGFATPTRLSDEQEKMARDSIYRLHPLNACIRCHTAKAHKAHPEYEK